MRCVKHLLRFLCWALGSAGLFLEIGSMLPFWRVLVLFPYGVNLYRYESKTGTLWQALASPPLYATRPSYADESWLSANLTVAAVLLALGAAAGLLAYLFVWIES